MQLLERLKKEWPNFTVLDRNAGRFCMRKVRKEDATQEISQIRALLPKTRYLQTAACFSLVLLLGLMRLGCSSGDIPSPSKAKVAVAQNASSSGQAEHFLDVGDGLNADRLGAVMTEVKKPELQEQLNGLREKSLEAMRKRLRMEQGDYMQCCPLIKNVVAGFDPAPGSIWYVARGELWLLMHKTFDDAVHSYAKLRRNGTLAQAKRERSIPLNDDVLDNVDDITAMELIVDNGGLSMRHIGVLNVSFHRLFEESGEEYLPEGYYRATGEFAESWESETINSTITTLSKAEKRVKTAEDAQRIRRLTEIVKRRLKIPLFEKISDDEAKDEMRKQYNRQLEETISIRQKLMREKSVLEREADVISQKKSEEFAVSLLTQIDFTKVWNNVGISKDLSDEVLDKVMAKLKQMLKLSLERRTSE